MNCPKCKSDRIGEHNEFGLPLMQKYFCYVCHHIWGVMDKSLGCGIVEGE